VSATVQMLVAVKETKIRIITDLTSGPPWGPARRWGSVIEYHTRTKRGVDGRWSRRESVECLEVYTVRVNRRNRAQRTVVAAESMR
jgi:hypothetical protein